MDRAVPSLSNARGLSWSDYDSLSRSLPAWGDAVSSSSMANSLTSTTYGQLSPASTGVDIPIPAGAPSSAHNHGYYDTQSDSASSAAPMMSHSLSSSSVASTSSWQTMDYVGSVHDDDAGHEMPWERDNDDDDEMLEPKLEPSDDGFCLEDVQSAPEAPMTPVASSAATPAEGIIKKGRGRPRKHPPTQVPAAGVNKVTKGRSKTGCKTCRRRKKKCDEAKPRCMNCEKNAVVCEGYDEKRFWRSGKERAAMAKAQPLPTLTLEPLYEGLDTPEDMFFWKHYRGHLSAVLTVEGESPFMSKLIPIAARNRGLMHSILALSSKHIDYNSPYGVNLLETSRLSADSLRRRAEHHQGKAIQLLRESMNPIEDISHPDRNDTLMACYAQILCLFLGYVAEGNADGAHRGHLEVYSALIEHAPPPDADFSSFIVEFFQYHIFADELLRFPRPHPPPESQPFSPPQQRHSILESDNRLARLENWNSPIPISPSRLLGVADGLFRSLARITSFRNAIRRNLASGADPVVPAPIFGDAPEVELDIREWNPNCGDTRARVASLWKQAMRVYLFQTLYPPQKASPDTSMANSTEDLTRTEHQRQHNEGMFGMGILANTPPLSTSPSLASSPPSPVKGEERRSSMGGYSRIGPGLRMPPERSMSYPQPSVQTGQHPDSYSQPRPHTGVHQQQTQTQPRLPQPSSRCSSPPPILVPPHYRDIITTPISESVAILASFSPSDPAQRLLLIPCLLVGTACYAPHQQDTLREAVRRIRDYTGLRNADRVGELLEAVWGLMRQKRWEESWDWQQMASNMGLDFLCA